MPETTQPKGMFKDFSDLLSALTKVSIVKEGNAQYGHYVTLNEVIDKVMPELLSHHFVLQQVVGHDGLEPTLETKLIHESGEMISSTMRLFLKSPDPQSQGSAITYARRYSLMAMLCLVGEDDDGQAAQTAAESSTPATDKQRAYISTLSKQKGIQPGDQLTAIAEILGKDKQDGRLTSAEASKVINALKEMDDWAEPEPQPIIDKETGEEVPFE